MSEENAPARFTKPENEWSHKLSVEDRALLRKIVAKIHFQYYPEQLQTDREADRIIESLGPQVAESMVRKAVDAGLS
jgi:hypothetical protein